MITKATVTLGQKFSILEPLDLEAGISDGDESGSKSGALVLLLLNVLQRQGEHRLLEAANLFLMLPGLPALKLPDLFVSLRPLG